MNEQSPNYTQYGQPSYQPVVPTQQQLPRRGMSGCSAIALTVAILIVICVGVGLVGGAISGAFNSNSQASSGQQATNPPAPAPTVTSTPATTQQAVTDIANSVLNTSTLGTADMSVTFDAKTGYAAIKYTIVGGILSPASTAQIIKNSTYTLMRKLFTSGLPITEVYFRVDGPLTNIANGQPSVGPYAEIDLTAATAKKFNWANLTPDQAWGDYDSAFVRTH